MSTLAVTDSSNTASRGTLTLAGSLAAAAWLLCGALSSSKQSAVETVNAAALLAALGATYVFWRSPHQMAQSAGARLWLSALFLFAALQVSPFFQRATTVQPQMTSVLKLAAFAPFFCSVLLWICARMARNNDIRENAGAQPGLAGQTELLLSRPAVRLNLLAISVLLAGAGLGLSGLPLRAISARAAVIAALMLAVQPLLQVCALAQSVRVLLLAMALSLAACTISGALRYSEMNSKIALATAALEKDGVEEANKLYAEAAGLNATISSQSAALKMETAWALYYERKENFEQSLVHWRRIAEARGVAPETMLQIRRVLCKQGDSLTAWRRMIYFGFPAIRDPEIAPGIRQLGDKPNSDLRAKLLAAFLAWEENEPEAERRRRLEEVRKLLPNEPSACALLRRMGVQVPEGPMWLPGELIVGKKLTSRSLLGSIDELGEVDTVVVLDEGNWELALNARGTPLHQIWPIVRVELNGHLVSETQVTHAEDRDVPFTFKVHRGDIYHVKIIFKNMQEVLEKGSFTRRGLTINGLTFRRSKP
ncbi:MAG TPA: hypothetical protein VEK08_09995 [Planctomycetota bacterium]|nr:hypothetical protein [Planctomycetota bacterium]